MIQTAPQPQQAAQPDYGRIKSNISTMIDKGAPEADIDAYVASEGVTPEQLQQVPHGPASPDNPAQLDQDGTNLQGQFGDDPNRVYSQFAPEDEAHVVELLRTGKDDEAARFAASKGFDITNAADIAKAREQTGAINPDMVYSRPKVSPLDTGGAAGAATRGILDSATLGLAGKAGNLTRAVEDQLSGSKTDFMTDWNREADIRKGVDDADSADHPWTRFAGQLAGGAILPTGLEGLAARVEAEAISGGATVEQAHAAGLRAIRNRIIQVGGGYGAAHGAFSADNPAGAVTGAVTEGALGAATAGALGLAGERLASRAPAAPTEGQATMAAAKRIGLDDAMLPADVGGATTRMLTSGTSQTPLGAPPIVKQAQILNERGAQVLKSNAATLGEAAHDVEGLGTAAIEGAQKYVASAKKVGGRMYDLAVKKAGDVKVDLQSARDTLDQQIARLKAVPGGGQGLEEAQALRTQLDQPFTVQGIRDWRTENFIDPKFRNTPVEGRMKAIVGAASRDVDSALRSGGHTEAADLYAAADNHWREMLANIKRNIEPVVGRMDNMKSAEGVASALNSASKNNGARLASFVRSLPEEQRGIVSASFLTPLGRDAAGAFTLSRFAGDWGKISPIAKRQAFEPELRSALDDLAAVGAGSKSAKAYANHSNTGSAIEIGRILSYVTALPTLGGSLAGQAAMGHLLASPRFARWLARAPRTALSAPAYVERLTRIARAEPQIANEVLQLQQRLAEAFNPTRLAADQGSGVGASGQPQEQQRETQGAQP